MVAIDPHASSTSQDPEMTTTTTTTTMEEELKELKAQGENVIDEEKITKEKQDESKPEIGEIDVRGGASGDDLKKGVVPDEVKIQREDVEKSSSSGSCSTSQQTGVIGMGSSSLSNLLVYSSESSDSSDSESSSSSESESYESPEVSDNDQSEEAEKADNKKKKTVQETIRTFGELTLDDLPPVPDVTNLKVDVPEHECVHIGNITGIIDRLVTVESLPNTPAYDLETLLFLDNGKKPLGYVYDVMGQVSSPIYVIRFNTKEEMDSIGVTKGLPVYSAPKTSHTQYVFLKQLMQVKGSDASWTGDNEVPAEHADYSDDEEERKLRRGAKKMVETRKRNSLERHKDFEKDMNVKNIIDTRLHKIRDSFEPSTKRHASNSNNNNNDKRQQQQQYVYPQNCGASTATATTATAVAPAPVFGFAPSVPSFAPFLAPPFVPPGTVQLPPFGPLPFMPPPPHGLPPMARPMPPHVSFIPTIPPPPLPQAMTTTQAMTAPPPPQPMQTMRHAIAVAAPRPIDMTQPQKHPQQMAPRMLYAAPEMTLVRPPTRTAFVPLFNPRVPSVWTYQQQGRPQTVRPAPQAFCQVRPAARGVVFFPKK